MADDTGSIFETGQVLLFDKPLYWTSFDLVNKVRGLLRKSLGINKIKVGHAGTLDPFATGVMVLLIGREYTRLSDQFLTCDKCTTGPSSTLQLVTVPIGGN